MDLDSLARDIKEWGRDAGFQQVGITDTDLSAYREHVRASLALGRHGTMGYLARNLDKRLDPALLEPETCRVIAVRMDYLPDGADPVTILGDPERAYVSRYAVGRDYHKVIRRRLAALARRIDQAAQRAGGRYRAFTDSAPVLEKALAEKAGLGWIGKHTLLINRASGSWFFLGEIYTNLPLPVDAPSAAAAAAEGDDGCGRCKACMTVCPTGAIVGPRELDSRRCISYLTIEHKGSIDEALRPLMGNRVFGCDDCQIFCPWNRHAQVTGEPDFTPRHRLDQAGLLELFAWSEPEFAAHTEGSAIRRVSFDQWQRNLAVAIGNGPPTAAAIASLRARRAGASDLVREHIDWALARLEDRAALIARPGAEE